MGAAAFAAIAATDSCRAPGGAGRGCGGTRGGASRGMWSWDLAAEAATTAAAAEMVRCAIAGVVLAFA